MVVLLIGVGILHAQSLETVEKVTCIDLQETIQSSLNALWEGDLLSMREGIEQATLRLDCPQPLVKETLSEDLGTFYLLRAYDAHLQEQSSERDFWLQQTLHLDFWDPNFGPEMEALRQQVDAAPLVTLSTIPQSLPQDISISIDGILQDLSEPIVVPTGMYWVELAQEDTIEAQWLQIKEGTFVSIPTHMRSTVSDWEVSTADTSHKWLSGALLWTSLAVSTHTIAMMHYQQYSQATSLAELDQQRTQTWRWGQGSLVSGGLAVTSLGIWLWTSSRGTAD